MFGSLDTSTSGLVAQRQRMEVIADNMANMNTIEGSDGSYQPFRRKLAIFAPGDPVSGNPNGVHMSEVKVDYETEMRGKFQPGHPFADEKGMVYYPNVSPEVELINALEVSRAYEANITAAEATKEMLRSSLRLLA